MFLMLAQVLQLPNLSEGDRLNHARVILSSGQVLLTLLNDILDLSKIEADRIELENSVFLKLTTVGVLASANFHASTAGTAADSTDFVLYDMEHTGLGFETLSEAVEELDRSSGHEGERKSRP